MTIEDIEILIWATENKISVMDRKQIIKALECCACEEYIMRSRRSSRRKKRMMANEEYSCAECANAATPICELCRYVAKAGGGITKPTRFLRTVPADTLIEMEMTEEEKKEAGVTADQDAAIMILAYITEKQPIPLRYVMLYNELTASKEGGNGQTTEKADDAGNDGECG